MRLIGMLTWGIAIVGLSLAVQAQEPKPPTIDVTGTAQMQISPTYARISVSVTTLNKDVRLAQKLNDEKAKKVLAVVEKDGVSGKDVATEDVSLEREEEDVEGKAPIFLGYKARTRMVITLREMSTYDGLIADVIEAGVDGIGNVRFGSDDEVAKRKEVRILAIKAAKEKADYLAAALGQKVCAPIKISESSRSSSNYYRGMNEIVLLAPAAVKTSLAPSNITITASIDVTFLLCR
ncbi:MAG: SIMPL domain-containing protein [Acidobacteriota bacterium]